MAHLYPLSRIGDLISLLSPHAPSALPLLGSLSSVGEVTEIYSSFPPDETLQLAQQQVDGAHPFFVVLAHMTGGKDSSDQGRMYCSSERGAGENDSHDSQLVYAFVKSYMGHVPPVTSRYVGTVHHRWVNALRTNTSYVSKGPVAQWVAPPHSPSASQPTAVVLDGYYLDRLASDDIQHVIETSKVPRTYAYILSRLAYSVCVRETGTDALVAWGLLHADCSIGTVFVEPAHRGKRLAKAVVESLPLHWLLETTMGKGCLERCRDGSLDGAHFG
jgi:hypothetical protein